MIYEISEELVIEPILNMIKARKDIFKIPEEKVKRYLQEGIQDKNSIIIIDEKDKKINGFVFASVEEFNGEDVCFIHSCIVDMSMKYTVHDFIARLRKWSKERNLTAIIMSTPNHVEGFKKKYGFEYLSTLMILDVEK